MGSVRRGGVEWDGEKQDGVEITLCDEKKNFFKIFLQDANFLRHFPMQPDAIRLSIKTFLTLKITIIIKLKYKFLIFFCLSLVIFDIFFVSVPTFIF